jgi:hypothetical protein
MSQRSDHEEHVLELRAQAVEILNDLGWNEADSKEAVAALASGIRDYCLICAYRRKSSTGAHVGRTLRPISKLDKIVLNRQRDGDNGNLWKRASQLVRILLTLYDHPEGLTDEQLCKAARFKSTDSAKGARSGGLMQGGWVEPKMKAKFRWKDPKVPERWTRPSKHDSPMTVWKLTKAGRREIDRIMKEEQ